MKRVLFVLLSAVLTFSAFSPTTRADKADPVVVAPATVGLSSPRLANIRTVMSQHVADKKIAGASGLIAPIEKPELRCKWTRFIASIP
jgi:hypothetical protein